jgi:Ca-activated chloride channel family protein
MPDTRSPEAAHGGAQILTPDGRSLPLVSARLRIDAGGGLARVVLEQTFANPYEETLRVTYKMPLPVDGAVSGYAFHVGSRTITGKIDRKESARARFEEAIVQGRTAALLEQDKADIFTQEIGNIPGRRTIVAEITIDQRLAWKPEGEWELRFPTVIGPRYIGAHVAPADAQASHVEVADGGVRARLALELRIADPLSAGGRVTSPSHGVVERGDGVVELAQLEGAKLDRDVVVRWPVAGQDVGLAVQTARPGGQLPHGRNAYALLSIVPPAPDARFASVPRDLIVLLDTSGSMDGPPLEQGKRVVAALIDSLSEIDRLEVVEFSMHANRYTKTPVPGTPREKQKAIAWVMGRSASGGTEMQSAIVEALHGLRPGAQRQVVLVTDGYVGGEEQIVTLLHESLPASCRMHVVGVGSAVNRNLAASLARAGRGAEVLVGLDEDAERFARQLVDKTRSPVLTDVVIRGDALVEHAPEHVPDVFAGAPVLAALQVRPGGGEIVVQGKLAHGTWEQRIQVAAVDPGEGNQAIVKLFGRERVADLEMRWSIGREVQRIDSEIESIGLVFQIATRRTSWLAIDDDRSVDPRLGSHHEEIPQELPYGTTMASFGAPLAPQPMVMQMTRAGTLHAPPPPASFLPPSETVMRARRSVGPMSTPLPRPAPAAGFGGPPPPMGAPMPASGMTWKVPAPSDESEDRDDTLQIRSLDAPSRDEEGGGGDHERDTLRAPAPLAPSAALPPAQQAPQHAPLGSVTPPPALRPSTLSTSRTQATLGAPKTHRGRTYWALWALILVLALALAVSLGWLIFR